MEAVKFSDEQFNVLIDTVKSLAHTDDQTKSKGSFNKCSARFGGQLGPDAVDEFITAIETYKDIEGINDADALKGFPLLLFFHANVWWKGVRRDIQSWEQALKALREHFAPTQQPYEIYKEIFESKQGPGVAIDTFVCQKRALLAKLPDDLHDEETELNFIYGLLAPEYRQHIPRHEIKSFRELLEMGRNLERTKK